MRHFELEYATAIEKWLPAEYATSAISVNPESIECDDHNEPTVVTISELAWLGVTLPVAIDVAPAEFAPFSTSNGEAVATPLNAEAIRLWKRLVPETVNVCSVSTVWFAA
jgi:hypothetical protein